MAAPTAAPTAAPAAGSTSRTPCSRSSPGQTPRNEQVAIRNESHVECGEATRVELRADFLRFERRAERGEIILPQDFGLRTGVALDDRARSFRRCRPEQVH